MGEVIGEQSKMLPEHLYSHALSERYSMALVNHLHQGIYKISHFEGSCHSIVGQCPSQNSLFSVHFQFPLFAVVR